MYKYAICKSAKDADILNQFIFNLYKVKFPEKYMEKWCDVIKHKSQDKWAVPIFHIWIGMYESPVQVEYAENIDGWVEISNENF